MPAFSDYVGVPYAPHGSSPRTGWDCLGLVRHVLAEHFATRLPADYAARYSAATPEDSLATLIAAERAAWRALPAPEPGAVAVLRVMGVACHVGVVVDDNWMLHTLRGRGTVLERFTAPAWRNRIEGFYRYERAC